MALEAGLVTSFASCQQAQNFGDFLPGLQGASSWWPLVLSQPGLPTPCPALNKRTEQNHANRRGQLRPV